MTPVVVEAETPAVEYPDSDGKPMAENTLQYEWIVTVQGNLDLLYATRLDVFVAGDNLIYPVEGQRALCQAPDVYVAFDRPKGHRDSYKVWEEGGIFPQVVFEVLSPGNRFAEMARKFVFYETHGAEEYYIIDPDRGRMTGYLNRPLGFEEVADMNGWSSPRLGVRFVVGDELAMTYADGRRFLSFVELGQLQEETARRAEQERQRAEQERARADTEKTRADAQQARADAQQLRADRLAAKLRELGVDLNGT